MVWNEIIKGKTKELFGSEYQKNGFAILDKLLIAAGHRLAILLDEIFQLE